MFVNINSSLEFQKALSVNGAYIHLGKEYARVTEKEIKELKLLVGDVDITDIEINSQHPKVGDTRKTAYGPLSGLE